jgi:hypothetical protein
VTTARIPAARDRSANILHDPSAFSFARVEFDLRRLGGTLRGHLAGTNLVGRVFPRIVTLGEGIGRREQLLEINAARG